MTTKEEKARLKSMRMLLVELINEFDEMLGEEKTYRTVKQIKKEYFPEATKKEEPEPKGPMKIGDLNIGDEGITIEAEILEIEMSGGRAKETGKPYKVTKITLSDKSGPIKLVLWNEQTEQAEGLEINDVIKVEAWKVEKGYKGGVHELVYGQFGTINKVNIERHII